MTTSWWASTSPRCGALSTKRSSSPCASSGTRTGWPACIPKFRRPRSTRTRISTPSTRGGQEHEHGSERQGAAGAGRPRRHHGTPLPDAVLDVWQTGPDGGYDIWDERQPEGNFRGRFNPVDESGAYEFQTMLPKPYTVPTDGPVGRYLEAIGQHPWRPAHIHFKVTASGYKPLVTQLFFAGDPYLDNDTIGAVKDSLVRLPDNHDDQADLRERGLDEPFLTCDFD